MFYGIILVCSTGLSEPNVDDCMIYTAPSVFESREECVDAVLDFLKTETFALNMNAMSMAPANLKCVDVTARDIVGLQT